MHEVLRCRVGGSSISVGATSKLHKELFMLRRQVGDFLTDTPADLRMDIFNSRCRGPEHNVDQFHFTLPASTKRPQDVNRMKQGARIAVRRWLDRIKGDAIVYQRFQDLSSSDESLTYVPLTSGFLWVSPEKREAVLLLPEEQYPDSGYREFSRAVHACMVTLNALIAFLAIYLAESGDGVAAHATGINFRGDGYLFLAPSGGGKTSLAMHSAPGTVLADDGIIIRRVDDGYKLFPTPFRQRFGGRVVQREWHRSSLMLKAAFHLEKGSQTRVKPVSRPQSMGSLINGMTHFFMWMQPQQAIRVFDFWRQLSSTTPVAAIQWQLKSDIWKPIDRFLRKEQGYDKQKEAPQLAFNISGTQSIPC